MRPISSVLKGKIAVGLAVGICISVALMSWFGYYAVVEWRRSSLEVADRRASEAADLLLEALRRDMQGVQQSVLPSPQWRDFTAERPYELSNLVASTFARYPYPESFFAWKGERDSDAFVFFNRSNRPPGWLSGDVQPARFPVTIVPGDGHSSELRRRILQDAGRGRRFSAFELNLDGVAYQIITQLTYQDPFHERLAEAVGFMVNLSWVSEHYFKDLTRQVAQIGDGAQTGLNLTVIDPQGEYVAGLTGAAPERPALTSHRSFALMFFDPLVITLDQQPLKRPLWSIEVTAVNDPTLAQAISGANRTLVVGGLAALALAIGLVLTIRAERTYAKLAELRSDFVSTVTHELKTPIATIRAAAETLSGGRITGIDTYQEYGRLVTVEAKRLTRLVENLLAYSRIADVADVYTFEPVDPAEFFEDLQRDFQSQLREMRFEFRTDIPSGISPMRGDRLALRLLFDNLIDNALRYSEQSRSVHVRAYQDANSVRIEVTDSGIGIPEEEISNVTKRFVRGRRSPSGGSGLGLAIAARIAADHLGALDVRSVVSKGTTVTVTLPSM